MNDDYEDPLTPLARALAVVAALAAIFLVLTAPFFL